MKRGEQDMSKESSKSMEDGVLDFEINIENQVNQFLASSTTITQPALGNVRIVVK